jgi:hypothetical protein
LLSPRSSVPMSCQPTVSTQTDTAAYAEWAAASEDIYCNIIRAGTRSFILYAFPEGGNLP